MLLYVTHSVNSHSTLLTPPLPFLLFFFLSLLFHRSKSKIIRTLLRLSMERERAVTVVVEYKDNEETHPFTIRYKKINKCDKIQMFSISAPEHARARLYVRSYFVPLLRIRDKSPFDARSLLFRLLIALSRSGGRRPMNHHHRSLSSGCNFSFSYFNKLFIYFSRFYCDCESFNGIKIEIYFLCFFFFLRNGDGSTAASQRC